MSFLCIYYHHTRFVYQTLYLALWFAIICFSTSFKVLPSKLSLDCIWCSSPVVIAPELLWNAVELFNGILHCIDPSVSWIYCPYIVLSVHYNCRNSLNASIECKALYDIWLFSQSHQYLRTWRQYVPHRQQFRWHGMNLRKPTWLPCTRYATSTYMMMTWVSGITWTQTAQPL